jgi:hypothetical protein
MCCLPFNFGISLSTIFFVHPSAHVDNEKSIELNPPMQMKRPPTEQPKAPNSFVDYFTSGLYKAKDDLVLSEL